MRSCPTLIGVTEPSSAVYPAEWETDVVLSDGSTASVRPIRSDDVELLDAFHRRQSQESVYFRFFRYRPELSDKELAYFTNIDYEARMAFVAILGGELVAVARYETWDSPHHPDQHVGEVAFFTDDEHHGKGLATLMLEFLAAAARRNGLDRFSATVLPQNYNMLRVFRRAGFEVSTRFEDGAIEVDLGIDVTGEATQAIATRGRVSQARSVERIFEPSSVAVIGASRTPGAVGYELVRNIVAGGFAGDAYLVNNRAESGQKLHGLELFRSLVDASDVGEIDLAIVAVPAHAVESVVEECIAHQVRGLVVISAGFSESGPAGVAREQQLVEQARHNGIRLIGPNSFGLVNNDPAISLRAVYAPIVSSAGSVGFLSQSGPLGAAVLQQLRDSGVGVSTFAALGNRADVSLNDVLQYWAEDEATKVVALYAEGFGNLRNFTAIAQHLSTEKPVVAVAPSDPELAEMLEQSGLILVEQVADLASQCRLVLQQPLPLGRRVAVISNAASVARLAASACRKAGLEPTIPSSIAQTPVADAVLIGDLDSMRLPEGSGAQAFEQVIVAAAVCPEIDSILVALVPTFDVPIEDMGTLLHQVNRAVAKPIVAAGLVDPERLGVPDLPVFTFPEQAAQALGRLATHARWRQLRGSEMLAASDAQQAEYSKAVVVALDGAASRALSMSDAELAPFLEAVGLPIAAYVLTSTAGEAVEAADLLGYPVVLKAGGLEQRSAGESGGVALDLQSAADIAAAFERMSHAVGPDLLPAIVQRSVPSGTHLRVAIQQSPSLGARLSIGIGGSSADQLPPQARLVLPTSLAAIDQLLNADWLADIVSSEAARLALQTLLASLAVAADADRDLSEIVCNPVLVSGDEIELVDVDVILQTWPRGPLAEVRHL